MLLRPAMVAYIGVLRAISPLFGRRNIKSGRGPSMCFGFLPQVIVELLALSTCAASNEGPCGSAHFEDVGE